VLALYHLFSGVAPGDPLGVDAMLADGRAALDRIRKAVGRVDASWRPALPIAFSRGLSARRSEDETSLESGWAADSAVCQCEPPAG
jgi:hypothetical protein